MRVRTKIPALAKRWLETGHPRHGRDNTKNSVTIFSNEIAGIAEVSNMSQTATPTRSFGFFLNGNWHTHGREAVVTSPYDHSVLAVVSEAERDDVETAIESAVQAFAVTRKMTSHQRASALRKVADGITTRREEFARTICQEAGKPIKTARIEVERAINTFQIAAEESTRIYGEYIPLDTLESTSGRWGLVRRFPLGPVFAITPFNFPLNLVAHKVAPAMAAGCPLILKPAPQTPISSLLLAEIVQESGWPEGAFAVMPLSNDNAALLVADDRIKLLTFTGSAAVGWQLKSRAGKKRVTLELGGNAGVIVHSDADLEHAAQRCVAGGFSYAGQTCISVQRILVHQPVFENFTELLLKGVRKLKLGDPMQESTDVPPLIREQDAVRVVEWIDEAVKGGAKLLCGGKRNGAMVEPTVLTGTSPGNAGQLRRSFCAAGDGRALRVFSRGAAPDQQLALRAAGRRVHARCRAHPDGV